MLNSEDLSFNYSERRTLVAHEVNRHFQMQNNILNLHSCRLSSATWKSRSDAFQLQGRVSCVHVKTFGVELSQSHVHGKLQRSTGNIYRQWAEEKIWRYNNTNTAEPPFAEKPTCFVRRSFQSTWTNFWLFSSLSSDSPGWEFPSAGCEWQLRKSSAETLAVGCHVLHLTGEHLQTWTWRMLLRDFSEVSPK